MPFTAFTGRRKAEHIPARLIVRRGRRLNPAAVPQGQGELFTTWRDRTVFTASPQPTLDAEAADSFRAFEGVCRTPSVLHQAS